MLSLISLRFLKTGNTYPRLIRIIKKVALALAGLVLLLALLIGFVFQFVLTPERITPKVVSALNQNLEADLSLGSVELTFFKTFPRFKLELEQGLVLKPMDSLVDPVTRYRQDTLMQFDYAVVDVNPIAFLRDKIKVNRFSFVKPRIHALVTPEGEVNWDILKEPDSITVELDSIEGYEGKKEEFKASIELKDISITDGELIFDDRFTGNFFRVDGFDLNLEAYYDEKDILLDLETGSENLVIRQQQGTWTEDLELRLVTELQVNRENKEVQVSQASLALNDLDFRVSGTIQPDKAKKELKVDLLVDLAVPSLNTLIDLVPEALFDKTEKYSASGEAHISSEIRGVYKKGSLPGIRSKFTVRDGSVSYNSKPNQIELIQVNADLYIPPDRGAESSFEIHELLLKGAGTDLSISGSGRDIFDRGAFELDFAGKLDLDALRKTLPFKNNVNLKGKADMALKARFDLEDVKREDYGRIQALGSLTLDDIAYLNPNDSLDLKIRRADVLTGQDRNSELLTEKKARVIGGQVSLKGVEFRQGQRSRAILDVFDAKFASTPLKDTNQVATVMASVLIDNASLSLGDSLKGKIRYLNGRFGLSPKKGSPKEPEFISEFQVDSMGAVLKSRRIGLVQAGYDIRSTRVENKWRTHGDISFGTLYAFTPGFPLPIEIPKTRIVMRPGLIELDQARLKVGQSDLTATGRVYEVVEAFFEDKMFKGELEVSSELLQVNEMIQALNEGASFRESVASGREESEEVPVPAADSRKTVEQPRSFVVPANLDLRFQSHLKKVMYKRFTIYDIRGLITIKDQKISMSALKMNTMAAKMATSVNYASMEPGKANLDFDFLLYDIDLDKLTDLFPVIDSLLPMADSFEGKVNFRMKGASALDKSLGMVGPSLDAIARVEGNNLVILDGKTFQRIAKILLFKNKERNTIDRLEFAMVFQDAAIEVFPSVITVDRYKIAVGGRHRMDLTYDYHLSILKSPVPFKAGIDITGTDDDLDFKITKAKYKHLFSTKERQQRKADSTLIRRKLSVMQRLPFSSN